MITIFQLRTKSFRNRRTEVSSRVGKRTRAARTTSRLPTSRSVQAGGHRAAVRGSVPGRRRAGAEASRTATGRAGARALRQRARGVPQRSHHKSKPWGRTALLPIRRVCTRTAGRGLRAHRRLLNSEGRHVRASGQGAAQSPRQAREGGLASQNLRPDSCP